MRGMCYELKRNDLMERGSKALERKPGVGGIYPWVTFDAGGGSFFGIFRLF